MQHHVPIDVQLPRWQHPLQLCQELWNCGLHLGKVIQADSLLPKQAEEVQIPGTPIIV